LNAWSSTHDSYRFRLVSISCDTNFKFSIDGHQLTVIEVDGTNHEALIIDQVQIFAAQRYSLVVRLPRARLSQFA
jgi:iron transport multicopper oxidase